MKISFVIPAHNEENNLKKLIPALVKELDKYIFEIIVVNDASKDKTKEVGEKLAKKYKRLKMVNRAPPCGVGRALRDGYKAVSKKSDWVLSMDCDFLENVKEIKRLIKKAQQGYDGVLGSRYISQGKLVNYPFIKKVANRIYHALVRSVLGIKQKDLTNNFKLYKREIFQSIEFKSNDFAINAETGILPVLKGYDIAEVPVSWIQRTFDTSDFKVFKLAPSYLKVAFRAIKLKFLSDK
ncbi:MAG: Glycosyltransferase AglD [Candidatus Woesearchaeota archaeon]|nr:Glycosyltransferase AglD [Candidatus Woesearchaeota archaeon]